MASGLHISGIVNVAMSIAATAAATRNFGNGLIVGPSSPIDTTERIRIYYGSDEVAADFDSTSLEYKAAVAYFSQSPKPQFVYIGRWAKTATSGILRGGVLQAAEMLMANFTAITDGSMDIDVDGTTVNVTGLDFSAALNLNGVAAILSTAITGASVVWDASSFRFFVESDSTGATSSIGYATAGATGTDVSALFKLTSATASAPTVGIAAESLLACMQALVNVSNSWYSAIVQGDVDTADFLAAAQYVESLSVKRMLGKTIKSSTALDATNTSDLPSLLHAAGLSQTYLQYSADETAAASFFGRAAVVDFEGEDTTITMKFKVEPGVIPETLTETQAATLKSKRVNVYVNYDNDTAIVQEGVVVGGRFFDEVHGLDWLQNSLQTNVYNVLYTSKKVPQTNAGMNRIATAMVKSCKQAVRNGLVAPGEWTGPNVGSLKTGDTLTSGYYIHVPLVEDQSQSDREARKSVSFVIALKLAGAVHSVLLTVEVNR